MFLYENDNFVIIPGLPGLPFIPVRVTLFGAVKRLPD